MKINRIEKVTLTLMKSKREREKQGERDGKRMGKFFNLNL